MKVEILALDHNPSKLFTLGRYAKRQAYDVSHASP
jgi:hypothetical protein